MFNINIKKTVDCEAFTTVLKLWTDGHLSANGSVTRGRTFRCCLPEFVLSELRLIRDFVHSRFST